MLTIRLQRTGKKNQADFRIVLAEKQAPVKKKFLEILGTYNPRKKAFRVKEERVKELVAQNVSLSSTIHNLLISKNLLEGKKVQAFKLKKKDEPKAAAETKTGAAAEASKAEVPAEKPAEQPKTEQQSPAEAKPEEA